MSVGNTPDWYRHAGDVGDTIVVTVSASLGATLSYVVSVTGVLTERVTGAQVVLAAAVTDSAAREVTVTLGAWLQNTAIAKTDYLLELSIVSATATTTFPESPTGRLNLRVV